ncbi:hypothetical protein SAMN05421854_102648 [Amycolatopsis rubida]|uniref:Uncharacterized protein n=1 Tax=Amycolatopsis rubida TaxID=112413 RepID=A0A1I5IRV1_9PSEU|nr:hypothetical protein SAMN05421854_102648 [Amycolatopsis rubida]
MFSGPWVGFAFLGGTWWQLLIAVLLAVVFAQLVFVGHDAGHKQIFRTRRRARRSGRDELPAAERRAQPAPRRPRPRGARPRPRPPGAGFHQPAGPRETGFSPLAGQESGGSLLPAAHPRWAQPARLGNPGGVARRDEDAPRRRHLADRAVTGCRTRCFSCSRPVTFVVVHQALWGIYLGCSFAPNHKGMPTMTGRPAPANADLARHPRQPELPDRAPPLSRHTPPAPAPHSPDRGTILPSARDPLRTELVCCTPAGRSSATGICSALRCVPQTVLPVRCGSTGTAAPATPKRVATWAKPACRAGKENRS